MAGVLQTQISNLTGDPDFPGFFFQHAADLPGQLGDRQDLAERCGGFRRKQLAEIPLCFDRPGH